MLGKSRTACFWTILNMDQNPCDKNSHSKTQRHCIFPENLRRKLVLYTALRHQRNTYGEWFNNTTSSERAEKRPSCLVAGETKFRTDKPNAFIYIYFNMVLYVFYIYLCILWLEKQYSVWKVRNVNILNKLKAICSDFSS